MAACYDNDVNDVSSPHMYGKLFTYFIYVTALCDNGTMLIL